MLSKSRTLTRLPYLQDSACLPILVFDPRPFFPFLHSSSLTMDWNQATFWLTLAGVIFAALGLPYLTLLYIAYLNPNGEVSKKLSPLGTLVATQADTIAALNLEVDDLHDRILALENNGQNQQPPPQPADPFGDVELVTTVRRRPDRA